MPGYAENEGLASFFQLLGKGVFQMQQQKQQQEQEIQKQQMADARQAIADRRLVPLTQYEPLPAPAATPPPNILDASSVQGGLGAVINPSFMGQTVGAPPATPVLSNPMQGSPLPVAKPVPNTLDQQKAAYDIISKGGDLGSKFQQGVPPKSQTEIENEFQKRKLDIEEKKADALAKRDQATAAGNQAKAALAAAYEALKEGLIKDERKKLEAETALKNFQVQMMQESMSPEPQKDTFDSITNGVRGLFSGKTADAGDAPETKTIGGATYVKKSDGKWYKQ